MKLTTVTQTCLIITSTVSKQKPKKEERMTWMMTTTKVLRTLTSILAKKEAISNLSEIYLGLSFQFIYLFIFFYYPNPMIGYFSHT